ncbi:porin [Candidatus Colwellia aromaticivorans]|uniref:porin n=1 Tax=Candidatus Colwellia aromaticivorans TaxID=2267621 RepID=UPI000DF3135F|nr:porin [Candidatus Colwellia aromaticivorans]
MKLVKNTIALAICSSLALPAFAADKLDEAVDFYGKLNISLQASEEKGESFNELQSNASRVGVKGKYKLDTDYDLTAIYKLEWQVNVNDDSKENLTARNQWVGLQGGFGEVTLGRSDTTLKVSQGKFDLFNDYEGDLKHLFIGENRVTDSLTYKSPSFNNVKFLASYILSEDSDLDDPFSIAVQFGDGKLKKTDFFLSLAHDQNMQGKSAIYETTRLVGMYQLGDLRLGAILTESEISEVFDAANAAFIGKSENGYAVNASYKIGKVLAKVQYQEFAGADAINIGADYKLGKNTKVFAWYTDREGLSFDGQTIKKATEGTYFAIGMEQKF